MKSALFSILAGILVAATTVARAQTFSLAGNWNFSSDSTSNEWAYGTSSGAFNGTNFIIPTTISQNGTTEQFWVFPPSAGGSDPNIEKNTGTSDFITSGADFRPGTVSFGPYQGPAIAQFTVQSTGYYNISATFQTDQTRTSTDNTAAFVYIGGVAAQAGQVLNTPINTQFGTPYVFSLNNVLLTAGEKVDFGVGGGSFTTQVDATLTELPEPSIWAMMLVGGLLAKLAIRPRGLAA